MLDDLVPIITRLPSQRIRIYCVADVHIGAKECMIDEFKGFIKRISQDEHNYLVLCGDILNNAVKSSVSDIYEEVMPPMAQKEVAHDILYPMKDRIMGMVMGNHEGRSRKDVDLDPFYDVAVKLGIEDRYRRNFGAISLTMEVFKKHSETYGIALLHGKSDTKNRKFGYQLEGFDAVVTGHTHNGWVERPSRLVFNPVYTTLHTKEIIEINAESWLRAGGYGLKNMYPMKQAGHVQYLEIARNCSAHDRKPMTIGWE